MVLNASLDKSEYDPGEKMLLTVDYDAMSPAVSAAGLTWTQASGPAEAERASFTATAGQSGGTVLVQHNGEVDTVSYSVKVSPPPPPPSTGDKCLVGMSAPDEAWAQRRQQVEAKGGKLQARRLFFKSLTANTGLIKTTLNDGQVPVCSWKVGDWSDVADGRSDAALKTLAGTLKGYGKLVYVAFHHEPDEQSTPDDVGEGGSAADFARMQEHIIDVMKPLAPNVKFSVIMNGWWWTAQKRKLSDASMEVWLPKRLREKLDVIAADDYSLDPNGEEAVIKMRNRVAWAKRVGSVKATGTGETNAYVASQLNNAFNYAKTESLFKNGWCLVWNSDTADHDFVLKGETLTAMQDILKNW